MTEKELAFELETDERTLRRWREEGCPHQRRSNRVLYRLPQVMTWLQERAVKALDADEAKERARKLRHEANIAARKDAVQAGELARVADMDAAVERLATAVRNEVAGLRSRFTLAVVGLQSPQEAAVVLDDMAKQILGALASAATAEDDDTDEELEEAA